jgi:hypothetical protein
VRFWSAILFIILLVGGIYVSQIPAVRALFVKTEKTEDPLDFLNDLPEVNPRTPPDEKKTTKPRKYFAGEFEPDLGESGPVSDQSSNSETSKVLMQVFKAKGLAEGISLSVSDDTIQVIGTVKSEAEYTEVLSLLEKGRGARLVDSSEFKVKP